MVSTPKLATVYLFDLVIGFGEYDGPPRPSSVVSTPKLAAVYLFDLVIGFGEYDGPPRPSIVVSS